MVPHFPTVVDIRLGASDGEHDVIRIPDSLQGNWRSVSLEDDVAPPQTTIGVCVAHTKILGCSEQEKVSKANCPPKEAALCRLPELQVFSQPLQHSGCDGFAPFLGAIPSFHPG